MKALVEQAMAHIDQAGMTETEAEFCKVFVRSFVEAFQVSLKQTVKNGG